MSLDTIKQNAQNVVDSIYSLNNEKSDRKKKKIKKHMKSLLENIKKSVQKEREDFNGK